MIKVGILGTGFGKEHVDIYKRLKDVEIVGVFGRTPEKLKELQDEFNVNVTTDIDELINDPSIDLIDVCLPTSIHFEHVLNALKNNKHVFCETPVSYTLAEAEEMKRYAEMYGKGLFVDLFNKFSDPHKFAIEKVKSNSLGKPLVVTAYQKTPPFWGDMNLDRIVQDFMLHNFDFITEILGVPSEVTAHGIEKGNSYVISTLKYEDKFAIVESSSMLPGKFPFSIGFTIVCETGTITFDGQFGESSVQKTIVYKDDEMEEISLPSHNDYEESIKHVINCISTNNLNSCISIDEAIKSLKIVVATKNSLNNNCSVKVL